MILLKCGVEDLTLGFGEQEIALLHTDRQVVGKVFVGHFRDLQIRHNVFNKVILQFGLALKATNESCSVEHYMTPKELQ